MYKVFLVDDEPWVLLGLKNMIDWREKNFLLCGEATDGFKAWERIQRLKPDVVFSDIKMPGIDGIELISKIRESEMDTEIVIISGYSEFEYAKAGLKYGCTDYLLKPVDEDELIEVLNRIEGRCEGRLKESTENKDDGKFGTGYLSETSIAKEMIQYIEEYCNEVTLQFLAEKFGMSVSSVSQIIKKNTGKSYSDHLLEIRMKKAQELLKSSNDSIENIAEKVGYGDYFYFMKVFKKATGISPSVFRRNL